MLVLTCDDPILESPPFQFTVPSNAADMSASKSNAQRPDPEPVSEIGTLNLTVPSRPVIRLIH